MDKTQCGDQDGVRAVDSVNGIVSPSVSAPPVKTTSPK